MTDADRELASAWVARIDDALKWRALIELGELGIHLRPTEHHDAESAGRYVFRQLRAAKEGGGDGELG